MSVPLKAKKAWLSLSMSSAHHLAQSTWAWVNCEETEKKLSSKNWSPTLRSKSLSLLRSAQSLRTAFSPPSVCSSRSWWLVFGRSPAVIFQFDGELLEEEIEKSPCQSALSGLQGKQDVSSSFGPRALRFVGHAIVTATSSSLSVVYVMEQREVAMEDLLCPEEWRMCAIQKGGVKTKVLPFPPQQAPGYWAGCAC